MADTGICTAHHGRHPFAEGCVQWDEVTPLHDRCAALGAELAQVRLSYRGAESARAQQAARATAAERERDKWREMYNSQCDATSRETETSLARLARATAAESALAEAMKLIEWTQGCVVRAAHALAIGAKVEGENGTGLRETMAGVSSGLMEVDAKITADGRKGRN